MLNFKCIANTNGLHKNLKFNKGLCLIHAGNITNNGTKDEVIDFLGWFKSLPFKHKIFIGGKNDYFLAEASLNEINKILPLGVQYLSNQMIEIEGSKIYGIPNSFNLFNVAFGVKNHSKWKELLRKIPENLDILITNHPSLGILDNECGCPELTKVILDRKPKIHIFNHVYQERKIVQYKNIAFINASLANSPEFKAIQNEFNLVGNEWINDERTKSLLDF